MHCMPYCPSILPTTLPMGSDNQIIVIKLLCHGGVTEPSSPLQNTHVFKGDLDRMRRSWEWRGWGAASAALGESGNAVQRGPASAFTGNAPMSSRQNWMNKGADSPLRWSKRADNVPCSGNCDHCCPHLQEKLCPGSHKRHSWGRKAWLQVSPEGLILQTLGCWRIKWRLQLPAVSVF